jgi:hypothetical protein
MASLKPRAGDLVRPKNLDTVSAANTPCLVYRDFELVNLQIESLDALRVAVESVLTLGGRGESCWENIRVL